MRRRARHLARDHRMVCRGQRRSRCHRHLELPRAVLGKKRIRRDAGGAHRRNETLAERPLAAKRIQTVRVAVAMLVAGVDELLLERRDQLQAGRRIHRLDGAAQELARAALPRRPISVADVTQKEMLGRGIVREVHAHLRRRIGHDHQITAGAERRVEDRPERGLHQVGMRPANALASARIDLAGRKTLAANVPRDVADANKHQFLAQHHALLSHGGRA